MEHLQLINNERKVEMDKLEFTVTRLSEGLKFGDGTISSVNESQAVLLRLDEAIASHKLLVRIDVDDEGNIITDDGCGDGRGVKAIFKGTEVLKRSLNRAKVFGGGAAMGVASLVGLGRAAGKKLQTVFDESIGNLQAKKMDFGAHIDDGEHPSSSGCGAIDKSPLAIAAAVQYESEIRDVINVLGIDSTGLDAVFINYRTYAEEITTDTEFSGLKVVDRIKGVGKVVKELKGPHKERRIILNTVRGFTVNQAFIRESTDDAAQVFAVDTWRLEDIANELYEGDAQAQHQALLGELVYTLGVAAVLTDGELPVDLVLAESISIAA